MLSILAKRCTIGGHNIVVMSDGHMVLFQKDIQAHVLYICMYIFGTRHIMLELLDVLKLFCNQAEMQIEHWKLVTRE